MHVKKLAEAGTPLNDAKKALVMLHGRGAGANDILTLATHLNVSGFALIAPEATNNTWYPYSFMAPRTSNEPWLSSALLMIKDVVNDIVIAGIAFSDIFLVGFSQGACLTLEFAARNAQRYGGVAAFTGGLIGETLDLSAYAGDFAGTPVYLGTSDPDPHVPVSRVRQTSEVFRSMNARVTETIYPGMGHTITQDEIRDVNATIFR